MKEKEKRERLPKILGTYQSCVGSKKNVQKVLDSADTSTWNLTCLKAASVNSMHRSYNIVDFNFLPKGTNTILAIILLAYCLADARTTADHKRLIKIVPVIFLYLKLYFTLLSCAI